MTIKVQFHMHLFLLGSCRVEGIGIGNMQLCRHGNSTHQKFDTFKAFLDEIYGRQKDKSCKSVL